MAKPQPFAEHMMLHMQQNNQTVMQIVGCGELPLVKRGGFAVCHGVLHKIPNDFAGLSVGNP